MISLILILVLIAMILLGVTIPVSMGIAIVVAFAIKGFPFYIIPQFAILTAKSWTLLAIPFFLIAGSLMNRLGITKNIFRLARAYVGHLKGGLAHVNVLASMIFAGISGSSVADIGGLGKIELEAMTDAGFDKKISAGITVASSVVGPIIPPSISFIIYGMIAEVSIAKMFLAGILPGIIIGSSLMFTTYFQAVKRPEKFPKEDKPSWKEIKESTKGGLLAIIAPILILLGMTTGFISPTEAGSGAIVYSLLLGLTYRTVSFKKIWESSKESIITTSHAVLLVGLASVLGYIMTFERTPQLIASLLVSVTNNQLTVLFLMSILFLVTGCFMSSLAALIVLTPILAPVAQQFGVDLVHFGVIISYGLQIGIATPPVGIGLYVISDIANMKLEDAISSVIPYLIPLIISLFVIMYCPQLCLFLPNLLIK